MLLEALSVENLELIGLFYTHVGELVSLQLICHENQWCGRGQPWFRAYHMDTGNFRFLGTQLVSCKDTQWKEMWKTDFIKTTFSFWKIDFTFIKKYALSTRCVSGTVLSTRDTSVRKDKVPDHVKFTSWWGEMGNKKVNILPILLEF